MKRLLSGLAALALTAGGAVATAATASAGDCVQPSRQTVSHTKSGGTFTVKVNGGKTLCKNLHIKWATWKYREPLTEYKNGSPSFPQDRLAQSQEFILSGKGSHKTVTFTVPGVDCGQWDVYANTSGISIPHALTRSGKGNGEPAPLSHYSNGAASYGHDRISEPECKPASKVETGSKPTEDCDATYSSWIKTTTPYVWNSKTRKWVPGAPTTTIGTPVKVDDQTPAYKKAHGCAKPEQPQPKVTTAEEPRETCDVHEVRTVTTTVPAIFDERTWTWKNGEPVVTYGDWTKVRDTTSDEKEAAGCAKPEQPQPEQERRVEPKTDCDGVWTRNVAIITPYVWDHASWSWVPGETTEQPGEWEHLSDATPADKVALDCALPEQPKDEVTLASSKSRDCETETTTETRTTIPAVFDEKTWTWGKGEPITEESTSTRKLTDAEKADAGEECAPEVAEQPKPDQPQQETPVPEAPQQVTHKEQPKPKAAPKVEKVAQASPAPEALAYTGSNVWYAVALAAGLLIVGGFLIVATRMARRHGDA